MRLDRLLTLYFFRPLLKLKRTPREPQVAILMYHSISEPESGKKVHPYYETCTSPQIFADQMKFLYDNNYQVITLDQAVALLKGSNKPSHLSNPTGHSNSIDPSNRDEPCRPNKPSIVLTFDDGFRDFYTEAFPILEQYGFSATVFLPTAFIGDKRKRFKGKECLTWGEVRELHEKAVTFGSHTVNHSKLIDLTRDEIEHELNKSKKEVEHHIGDSVRAFCYPFAFPEQDKRFVTSLLSLIKKCSYETGVTTRIGLAHGGDNVFTLKRIPVNSLDDENLFFSKINGAYDWLQKFQLLYKKAKELKKAGWSKSEK